MSDIETEIQKIIRGIGEQGNSTGNVMELLGYGQNLFQTGFEIANEMQNRDLVKLLYSNFNQNKIIVEFTLLGKAAFDKGEV
jgi:hypothetical protein